MADMRIEFCRVEITDDGIEIFESWRGRKKKRRSVRLVLTEGGTRRLLHQVREKAKAVRASLVNRWTQMDRVIKDQD